MLFRLFLYPSMLLVKRTSKWPFHEFQRPPQRSAAAARPRIRFLSLLVTAPIVPDGMEVARLPLPAGQHLDSGTNQQVNSR